MSTIQYKKYFHNIYIYIYIYMYVYIYINVKKAHDVTAMNPKLDTCFFT